MHCSFAIKYYTDRQTATGNLAQQYEGIADKMFGPSDENLPELYSTLNNISLITSPSPSTGSILIIKKFLTLRQVPDNTA